MGKIESLLYFHVYRFICMQSFVYASEEKNMGIVVQKSDKLINICRNYLEAPNQWRKIAKINRLSRPDLT